MPPPLPTPARAAGPAAGDSFELYRAAGLAEVDSEVALLLGRELQRQRTSIELVASENFTWPSALMALASSPANKLAEGYPGRRKTPGSDVVDALETTAIERAKTLFGAEHANVQPLSGAQANMAVYFACLQPGDTVLAMRPSEGGHTTHGAAANFSSRFYRFAGYGVDPESGLIDFDEVLRLAHAERPKLIVCGGYMYPRAIDVARFRAIADEVGALLLCDMAHFAGLVAAGLHPDPVPHADFVTSTVHKTLAGPRSGGFILSRRAWADAVDRAVSPGTQSAPLCTTIAAKAVCFRIAQSEAFRGFQARVRSNADALAEALLGRDQRLVTGGTDTHLMMLDLSRESVDGRTAALLLERARVTVNAYAVPADPRLPDEVSGLRLGTPAVTMRGFDEREMEEIAAILVEALQPEREPEALAARTLALCERHPLYPGFEGFAAWSGAAPAPGA